MASVYKRKAGLAAPKWYFKYRDAQGRLRRAAGGRDRSATLALANEMERRVARERAGLVDPHEQQARRPIAEHVEDFLRHLEAKRDAPEHIANVRRHVSAVVEALGVRRIGDLSADRVADWLRQRREADGLSVGLSNGYARSLRAFGAWLVRARRAPVDPLAHIPILNARTDRRRVRRALTFEEFARLREAAKNGGPFRGLHGPDRAMLYLVAVHTGLRRNELVSLTPRSFDLDGDPPTATVVAAYSKHRREDTIQIRPDLVDALRPWLAARSPFAPCWPGKWHRRAAKMLALDLDAAAVPYRDEGGEVVDFHGLRVSGITWVSRTAHPKALQTFARHYSAAFTLDVYARVARVDMDEGLSGLPSVSAPGAAAATGTAGACAPICALPPAFSSEQGRAADAACDTPKTNEGKPRQELACAALEYPHGDLNPGPETENLVS